MMRLTAHGSVSSVGSRASALALTLGAATLLLGSAACGGSADRTARTLPDSVRIARADTLLSEMAGEQFARLTRMQRWRTVATLGTGLPPRQFEREDLPDSDAMGAGLLNVYCVQCHWLPSPQMHSADEWEILMRRMTLRSRLLAHRAEGEHIPERFTAGAQFKVVPTPAHHDSLLAYLKRNALPVVEPERLPDTRAADLYVDRCTVCHETPSPRAHTESGWEPVLDRMQQNMRLMGVDTLSRDEKRRIWNFLQRHGAS